MELSNRGTPSEARIHPHWLPRVGVLLPTGVVSVASIAALQQNFNAGGLIIAVVYTSASLYVAAR
ncbi:hypothetical protein ACF1AJ_19030 [Leifsonia sp. NPDC014704]|uniref:hypothetical protein n=1 Tax=Leifsonia sp. NPDC014704 TaxID=3364123 RepID=UPI0036F49019